MATPLDQKMPEKIKRLPEIAYNIWWSWTPEARELFRRLDYPLWRDTRHNPVTMLRELTTEQLEERANDGAFHRLYTKVTLMYDEAMNRRSKWFDQTYPDKNQHQIAYFSFEFGLHNTLPIYSGGLGILSGDHTKEASDIGLPLVGIGFMYPQGYFRQRIPSHGWQEAVYEELDFGKAPIRPARDQEGNRVKLSIKIDGRDVWVQVWHVQVGLTNLYLMDTNVEENSPWERELSARLYYGGSDMRLKQEMLLGLGGVRLLRKLGYNPTVWHMNEGHSSFLLLELLREKVKSGMSFAEAKESVRQETLFTTHTPVPAGHDAFAFHMMERYFWGFWDEIGVSRDEFLNFGAERKDWGMEFNMTVLALNLAGQVNAVSKLHGEVSREMWQKVFPKAKSADEVPITHVTNGVHVPTWIAPEMNNLYCRYLGPDWFNHQDENLTWQRIADIPDAELWETHLRLKQRFLIYLQQRERGRWVNGEHDATQVVTGGMLLDPQALTIGFARRFATYKRGTLIFKDIERLRRLLLNTHRPVQILFAGKAHPADDPGKHILQEIYNIAKSNNLGGRVAVAEDYDMHLARYMYPGVDVWLNTPRRPREASGTSGMKASLNAVPNFSVSDGWWAEGYNGQNGWVIGDEREYENLDAQDWDDSLSLYNTLENQIVPLYYNRDRDGIPRGWIEIMKETARTNSPLFSLRRMLKEYTTNLYLNAMDHSVK